MRRGERFARLGYKQEQAKREKGKKKRLFFYSKGFKPIFQHISNQNLIY